MTTSLAFRAALARRIFLALGVSGALVACGDDATSGGGGQGGEAQGGEGQGGQAQGGEGQGGQAQGGQAQGGEGQGGQAQGGEGQGGEGGGGNQQAERCFFQIDRGACPTLKEAPQYYYCTDASELVLDWISGPTIVGDTCCYEVEISEPNSPDCVVIGRPLVVDHAPQRASVVGSGDRAWGLGRGPKPDVSGLDEATRSALSRAWAEDAAYEHASVASFSKFSLELMALGAPAHLLAGAHEAALDEIRHASLGFALASAYAGAPLSPAALPAAARVECAADLVELAVAAVREGCVGETLAAIVAGAQHAAATDAAVRDALAGIADDEARHAELAWRTVAWAIEAGGDQVRDAVRAAFDDALAAVLRATPSDEIAVHAHGRLSGEEALEERRRGVREVVMPAAKQLLG